MCAFHTRISVCTAHPHASFSSYLTLPIAPTPPIPPIFAQNMKIVNVAATWSGGFPVRYGEEEDEEAVVVRFARLLATLATEVMDSLKRVENSKWWAAVQVFCCYSSF